MKKTLAFIFLALFATSLPSLHAYYEDDEESGGSRNVRDYEHLRVLQQATGQNPGNSYFETRVSTLLNPATQATAAFDSQAREDAAVAQEFQAKARQDALLSQKNTARSRKAELGALPKNDNGLAGTNLADALKVNPDMARFKNQDSYVDATEENFQDLLAKKAQKEAETAVKTEDPSQPQKKQEERTGDGTSSLLKNNPFYFSGNVAQTRAEEFEIYKPLILSRMVQGAIPANEAEAILARSASQEEIIMALMEEYGKSYGEAKQITDTTKKRP